MPTNFQIHPQSEDYWGHVNPIGPRACYDEGKRVAETLAYAYAKQSGKCRMIEWVFLIFRVHLSVSSMMCQFMTEICYIRD